MSKSPSPRADQLRAMREAQFARYEQMKKEAEKAAAPAKPLAPAKPAAADAPEKPPAKSAARKPTRQAKEVQARQGQGEESQGEEEARTLRDHAPAGCTTISISLVSRAVPWVAGHDVDLGAAGLPRKKKHDIRRPHGGENLVVDRHHGRAERPQHLDAALAGADMSSARGELQHVADHDGQTRRTIRRELSLDQPAHRAIRRQALVGVSPTRSAAHVDILGRIPVIRFASVMRVHFVRRGHQAVSGLRVDPADEAEVGGIDVESADDRLAILGDRSRQLVAHDRRLVRGRARRSSDRRAA